MTTIIGILVALVLIGIIATIHELGHYLTGRKLGFKIQHFQIFVGPTITSWQRGDIKYSLHLIPLGAAVHFEGEYEVQEDEAGNETVQLSDDPGAFGNRPKAARVAVLSAGPIANILTGVLAFFMVFAIAGYTVPVLSEVVPNTQVAEAGLEVGDRIVSINGTAVSTDMDLSAGLMFSAATAETTLEIERDGALRSVVLRPKTETRPMLGINMIETENGQVEVVNVMDASNGGNPVLQPGDIITSINQTAVNYTDIANVLAAQGLEPFSISVLRNGEEQVLTMSATPIETTNPYGFVLTKSHNVGAAIPYSFQYSWSILRTTGLALGKLFVGEIKAADTLSGPVGIVSAISGAATQPAVGFGQRMLNIMQLFALISISIGFTNLLPIPLLDGNRLLLILVEAVRGKPLSYKAQNVISIIGIALILGLFAFALYADISRLLQG